VIKNEINDKTHNKVTNDNIKLNCNVNVRTEDGGQTSPEF